MIFCGHCGLQLPPGSTRCPRCGASVEPAEIATGGDLHLDDATIASRAFIAQNQAPSQTPINQQPLILRGNDYSVQDANGATSRVEQVNYNTQTPPTQQVRGNSYSGYPPLQNTGHPPLQSNSAYPIQNTGSYPPQASHPGYQSGMPYTNMPQQMGANYQQYPVQYAPQQQPTNTKGRTTGLILVFIGLLLILSAAILFAMQQGLIGSKRAGGGDNGGTTSATIATQPIQHYYSYTSPLSLHPRFNSSDKQNTQTQEQFTFYRTASQRYGTMKFIVSVRSVQ